MVVLAAGIAALAVEFFPVYSPIWGVSLDGVVSGSVKVVSDSDEFDFHPWRINRRSLERYLQQTEGVAAGVKTLVRFETSDIGDGDVFVTRITSGGKTQVGVKAEQVGEINVVQVVYDRTALATGRQNQKTKDIAQRTLFWMLARMGGKSEDLISRMIVNIPELYY